MNGASVTPLTPRSQNKREMANGGQSGWRACFREVSWIWMRCARERERGDSFEVKKSMLDCHDRQGRRGQKDACLPVCPLGRSRSGRAVRRRQNAFGARRERVRNLVCHLTVKSFVVGVVQLGRKGPDDERRDRARLPNSKSDSLSRCSSRQIHLTEEVDQVEKRGGCISRSGEARHCCSGIWPSIIYGLRDLRIVG